MAEEILKVQPLDSGDQIICGVDEAGRGPLAGPVFAAAVILPPGLEIVGLNDSKKLTAKKREALYELITDQAVAYKIATASVEEIDSFNILQATFLAMSRAVEALQPRPDLALIDGNRVPPLSLEAKCIIGGDAKYAIIAAASVLAKVARDRYMIETGALYPQYEFARHKGYGTKLHYERLAAYGPSPVHRISFLKNMDRAKKDETAE